MWTIKIWKLSDMSWEVVQVTDPLAAMHTSKELATTVNTYYNNVFVSGWTNGVCVC